MYRLTNVQALEVQSGYINEEHTQSLGKLKAYLISIFHLNSTHLAEPFYERVYNLQTQLKRYKNDTTLITLQNTKIQKQLANLHYTTVLIQT